MEVYNAAAYAARILAAAGSRMEEKPKAIAVGVAVAIDRSLTVSITLCHGIGNGKKIQATHAAEGSSEIPICPVCKQ